MYISMLILSHILLILAAVLHYCGVYRKIQINFTKPVSIICSTLGIAGLIIGWLVMFILSF